MATSPQCNTDMGAWLSAATDTKGDGKVARLARTMVCRDLARAPRSAFEVWKTYAEKGQRLERQNQSLQEEIKRLKQKQTKEASPSSELQQALNDCKEERDRKLQKLQQNLEAKETELTRLSESHTSYQEQLHHEEKAKGAAATEQKETEQQQQQKLSTCERDLKKAREELDTARKIVNSLRLQFENCETHIKMIEKARTNLAADLRDVRAQFAEGAANTKEYDEMVVEANEAADEARELRYEKNELSKKLEKAEKNHEDAQLQLQTKLDERGQELARSQASLEEERQKLKAEREKLVECSTEREQVTQQLKEATQTRSETEARLESALTTAEEAQKAREEALAQAEKAREDSSAATADAQTKQAEAQATLARAEELKTAAEVDVREATRERDVAQAGFFRARKTYDRVMGNLMTQFLPTLVARVPADHEEDTRVVREVEGIALTAGSLNKAIRTNLLDEPACRILWVYLQRVLRASRVSEGASRLLGPFTPDDLGNHVHIPDEGSWTMYVYDAGTGAWALLARPPAFKKVNFGLPFNNKDTASLFEQVSRKLQDAGWNVSDATQETKGGLSSGPDVHVTAVLPKFTHAWQRALEAFASSPEFPLKQEQQTVNLLKKLDDTVLFRQFDDVARQAGSFARFANFYFTRLGRIQPFLRIYAPQPTAGRSSAPTRYKNTARETYNLNIDADHHRVSNSDSTDQNFTGSVTFTEVWKPETTQEHVFEYLEPFVNYALMTTKPVTFLTFGPTGTGKSYTLLGERQSPGLLPRTLAMLVRSMPHMTENLSIEIRELFYDHSGSRGGHAGNVRRLALKREQSGKIQVEKNESTNVGTFPEKSKESIIQGFRGYVAHTKTATQSKNSHLEVSSGDLEEARLFGSNLRDAAQVRKTEHNATSSRSLYMIRINGFDTRLNRMVRLNFIDLPGAEPSTGGSATNPAGLERKYIIEPSIQYFKYKFTGAEGVRVTSDERTYKPFDTFYADIEKQVDQGAMAMITTFKIAAGADKLAVGRARSTLQMIQTLTAYAASSEPTPSAPRRSRGRGRGRRG